MCYLQLCIGLQLPSSCTSFLSLFATFCPPSSTPGFLTTLCIRQVLIYFQFSIALCYVTWLPMVIVPPPSPLPTHPPTPKMNSTRRPRLDPISVLMFCEFIHPQHSPMCFAKCIMHSPPGSTLSSLFGPLPLWFHPIDKEEENY